MIEPSNVAELQQLRDNIETVCGLLTQARENLLRARPRWMTTREVETLLAETAKVFHAIEAENRSTAEWLGNLAAVLADVKDPDQGEPG